MKKELLFPIMAISLSKHLLLLFPKLIRNDFFHHCLLYRHACGNEIKDIILFSGAGRKSLAQLNISLQAKVDQFSNFSFLFKQKTRNARKNYGTLTVWRLLCNDVKLDFKFLLCYL